MPDLALQTVPHTPGPWYAHFMTGGIFIRGDGRLLAEVSSRAPSSSRMMQENIANAKLMEAGPDLLEACRYMHKLLVDMGHGGLAGAILGENAIARAEGR